MKVTVNSTEMFGSPAIELCPEKNTSFPVLLLHGYGRCKEEMLPLATKLNMLGFICYIPDLSGHGKNKHVFSLNESETLIDRINYDFADKSTAIIIGHSVGALIAYNTKAKNIVAISPPAPQIIDFDGSKTKMLRTLRVRRVKENVPFAGLREILEKMQYPARSMNSLIIYAENDLSSIIDNSKDLSKKYMCDLKMIPNAEHNNVVSNNQTATFIIEFLKDIAKKGNHEGH